MLINLASTEAWPDPWAAALATPEAFEQGLDEDDPAIGPAMLYAYAALREGVPVANFTPSLAADVPALRALAWQVGVPLAGKDGKTGQTMMKTVLAPAFRSRALHVEGWYSTNILGNRDGEALPRPGLQRQQGRHQGLSPGLLPGLPGGGPRRAHRLLPAARGPEGGLGQHRPRRLPRPAHAGEGRLPVPRLGARRAAGPGDLPAAGPGPAGGGGAASPSSSGASSRRR